MFSAKDKSLLMGREGATPERASSQQIHLRPPSQGSSHLPQFPNVTFLSPSLLTGTRHPGSRAVGIFLLLIFCINKGHSKTVLLQKFAGEAELTPILLVLLFRELN